jgi:hypothetical protein
MQLDTEEVSLVASILVATIATFVDEFAASTVIKALKIVALILSLFFAYVKIKTSKPYFGYIDLIDWVHMGALYRVQIPRSTHGRGKTPYVKLQRVSGDGSISDISARTLIESDGLVSVLVPVAAQMRVEIRK